MLKNYTLTRKLLFERLDLKIEREIVNILGVKIDVIDLKGLLQRLEIFINSGGKFRIMYFNINSANIAKNDDEYKEILNSADLVYCDGFGIAIGAKLLGNPPLFRMTGADWIYDLCSFCGEKYFSLYFLGGEPGVSKKAKEKLLKYYPNLKISGTFHGYFNEEEAYRVLEEINFNSPDILLVGMGTPKQEKWINRNFDRINVPVIWSVGALFDFVSGKIPRGPRWMVGNGFEWFFRLVVEPRRLWRRYILGNPIFFFRILIQRCSKIFYYNNK